jgi:hypothetical protein
MNAHLLHALKSYIPPLHLVMTTFIRAVIASTCYVASHHLSGTLALVAGFIAHIGIFMALFGLIAHLEATFIQHVFSVARYVRSWLSTRPSPQTQ